MSLKNRILSGVAANGLSQLVVIGLQLISIPLFLTYWSIEKYGIWIMLSAVPAYLALADGGMLTAVSATVTRLFGAEQESAARRTLHTGCASVSIAVLIIMAAAVSGAVLLNTTTSHGATVVCLIWSVCVSQMAMLPEIVLRSHNKYHIAINWQTTMRVAEFAGQSLALVRMGDLLEVALMGAAAKTFIAALMFLYVATSKTRLKLGYEYSSWQEWHNLLSPALHYLLFPITGAVVFQGSTLIVGAIAGPTAVAIFSTYRTIARCLVQIVGAFSNTVAVEFAAHMDSASSHRVLAKLYNKSQRLAIISSAAFAGGAILALPSALKLWTQGAIAFDSAIASTALAYAIASSLGHVPKNFILSAGKHHQLAWLSLGAAVVTCLLGSYATYSVGANGMMIVLAIGDFFIYLAASRAARNIINSKVDPYGY